MLTGFEALIQNLEHDASSLEIVRAIVGLGKAMGMSVLAEGVESVAQVENLRHEGCDELQGYFFGSPVPASEARRMIAA